MLSTHIGIFVLNIESVNWNNGEICKCKLAWKCIIPSSSCCRRFYPINQIEEKEKSKTKSKRKQFFITTKLIIFSSEILIRLRAKQNYWIFQYGKQNTNLCASDRSKVVGASKDP